MGFAPPLLPLRHIVVNIISNSINCTRCLNVLRFVIVAWTITLYLLMMVCVQNHTTINVMPRELIACILSQNGKLITKRLKISKNEAISDQFNKYVFLLTAKYLPGPLALTYVQIQYTRKRSVKGVDLYNYVK